MKIAALCYDFPHQKTVQNLLALKANGFNDVVCFAAPKKTLNIIPSKKRVTPIIEALHPEDVARALGYEYLPVDHDGSDILSLIHGREIGVITGARILKKPLINNILPIINMHPGFLPYNRGLDNLKHAIVNDFPQAVTTHFIDENIDRGLLIDRQIIDVFEDDTYLDIFLRLQNTETKMMIQALKSYNKDRYYGALPKGTYFKVLDDRIDQNLDYYFKIYKKHYGYICQKFQSSSLPSTAKNSLYLL